MESVTTATLSLFFKSQPAAGRSVANIDTNHTFFFFFFAGTGYMTVMNISADVVSWIN